jgi:putative FmdB family regulatory protein
MPLYEYQCDACGRRFERIQKFSDPPIEVCPTCGGQVRKLVSSPAFQFKGTGWYVTDYSRKEKGESGSGTSGSSGDKAGDTSTSDSGKTGDAKPAAGKDGATSSKESKETKDSTPTPSGPTKS